jgi:hypothetical protein
MTLVVKDRVKETTSTTGTGALSLSGAADGFQSFAVIGNGNTTYYAITEPSTSAWEIGLGTYTLSGTTLARTTVLSSSNGGSAVNFAAGVKDVFVTYPAVAALSTLSDRGTGVTSTYVSTVAVGGTTFAQPAVSGEISSDQGYFAINYAGATGITVANLTAVSTYVYIDSAGNLQQQVTEPTREDWSRKMFTMRIAVDVSTNLILGFEYLNNPIGHYANSIRDIYSFLLANGVPFKKNQTVTGRADLGFDVGAGTLMEFGGTGNIHNANIKSFAAVANAEFFLSTRTGFDAGGNTDLPKVWDNAGTLTALGSTTVVGHRLYRFSNGNFVLQYGQGNYANLTLAKSGAVLENYVLNPQLENATFFGWWFIESTATTTNGTTLTAFSEYTIGIQGGSSGSLAGCLLKGNNLSDLLDASAARTNLGLGTAATTAATAYATAAQGALAASATQPADLATIATTGNYANLVGTVPTWNQNTTGNAATATNVAYSGLTGAVPTWNQNTTGSSGSTTGNAATATALQTARTIGGVSFNGSANINLPGVNAAGNQSTTGNAATATTLLSFRTINGVSFNGSANITVEPYVEDAVATSVTRYLTFVDNSTAGYKRLNEDVNLSYNPGTNVLTVPTVSGALSGNASTATFLQTARTIGGVSFNGSANINLPGVNTAGNQSTSGNAATATLAANSTLAGGLAVGSGVNSGVNQIVRTNSYGYADFGWINTVSGAASGTPSRVYCSQDDYVRYYDMPTFTGYVRTAASGSWGISVTGSSASCTGNAATATNAAGSFIVPGTLTVGNSASSDIYMVDTDEGTRRIHCNTNRIGFLTQAGGWGAYCDDSGNWTAAGNVTAYSDERLKKDWEEVKPSFVDQLANVKSGTYTRTDSDERQAGVSAQSLQELLPETVVAGNDGMLSVAYGNAAMVAVVELAKEIRKLKEELKALKGQ